MHEQGTAPPAIYYLCPDITIPSGGVRRIYRHVEILARHGFTTAVLHQSRNFQPGWFSSNVPVRDTEHLRYLRDKDILVLPEVCYQAITQQDVGYRRVVIALSWAYIYYGLAPGQKYQTFGITDVICGCEYIREFIAATMGLSGRVIRAGIETDRFCPAAEKALQIACMPRKNKGYLHNIECAFRSQFPQFDHVPFIRLEGVDHDQVAARLAESALFLSTGFPEGIARPVLEAMASECLVVGFHGRGGLEYMRHRDNCYVVPDADVLGASKALAEAIIEFQSRSRAMQGSARATALLYSNEREEEDVLTFWADFLSSG